MKKLMLGLVAAFAVTAFADPSVKINKVETANPWDGTKGTIMVDYSLAGLDSACEYEVAFDVTVTNETKTFTSAVAQPTDGTYTNFIDTATLFGAEVVAKNANVKISLVKVELGGVQLWQDGPYFAECNLGAEKPEEYGWYFWWGDTVGYKRNEYGWEAVDGSVTRFEVGQQNCPTFDKDVEALGKGGWIDDSGNLVVSDDAAKNHDAARAYLGAPWRMMTDAELQKLFNSQYCTSVWTNNYNDTGINGRLVTGAKDGYKDKSIFLPAAGYGNSDRLEDGGSNGYYWSSTPHSDNPIHAWRLNFGAAGFDGGSGNRYFGYPVRPVR